MLLEKQFCELVERQLKDLGWNRSDLARAMGVSPAYVTNYLTKRVKAGPEVMERFLNALGFEPKLGIQPLGTAAKQDSQKIPQHA